MSYNEKQQQIIDTAEMLFAVKGFEGTSVRDIAEAAGINIAMISYYFGSKEKLMEAIFEQKTVHIKMKAEKLLKDDSMSPFDKVCSLIDSHITKAVELQLFYKIMVTEQLINSNSSITDAVLEVKKKNLEIVTQIIEDGQRKGVFKKDIDVVLFIYTLVGTVSQTVMNQKFFKAHENKQGLTDEEFKEYMKQKLSVFLKQIFKSILINEASL